MKIKILKIKIENDQQTIELGDFFEGNSTLYDKFTHIIDEPDGKYWHLMVFYKTDFLPFSKSKVFKKEIPKDFILQIQEFIVTNPPITKRASNCIQANIQSLFDIVNLSDFSRFRGLGADTMAIDSIFLNGILTIILEYRKKM